MLKELDLAGKGWKQEGAGFVVEQEVDLGQVLCMTQASGSRGCMSKYGRLSSRMEALKGKGGPFTLLFTSKNSIFIRQKSDSQGPIKPSHCLGCDGLERGKTGLAHRAQYTSGSHCLGRPNTDELVSK